MGHSVVNFSVKGKLTLDQIKKEHSNKCSEDKHQYGYDGSPDSFYGSSSPSSRFIGKIYSESAIYRLIEKTEYYESYSAYFVENKIFQELFKKEYSKINKLKDKIKEIKDKWAKDSVSFKKDPSSKPQFMVMNCCNSKLNISSYSSSETPSQCPICRSSVSTESYEDWSNKRMGKKYIAQSKKVQSKIDSIKIEINKIEQTIPDSVDESQLTKSQKAEIRTAIFADVHH